MYQYKITYCNYKGVNKVNIRLNSKIDTKSKLETIKKCICESKGHYNVFILDYKEIKGDKAHEQ